VVSHRRRPNRPSGRRGRARASRPRRDARLARYMVSDYDDSDWFGARAECGRRKHQRGNGAVDFSTAAIGVGGATLGSACDGRPRPAFVVVRASRRRLHGPRLARGMEGPQRRTPGRIWVWVLRRPRSRRSANSSPPSPPHERSTRQAPSRPSPPREKSARRPPRLRKRQLDTYTSAEEDTAAVTV
jgi:hypothetical protein